MKDEKKDWRTVLVPPGLSVIEAINQMNSSAWRILLVVDEAQRLLGVVTDGDIRRYLLKHATLEGEISATMKKNPLLASADTTHEQLLIKMHQKEVLHIPIVDKENRVIGLETFDTLYEKKSRDNWVIIMAGGLGKRLYPLTLDRPKPLIPLGTKAISEILLENFIRCGFRNFYFSVNYKADMIRNHFEDGARWGVNIQYIQESEALGTAGSLSLLPEMPTEPFFVTNADILTSVNFKYILDYHQAQKNKPDATLCVRLYQHTIPFGVAHINGADHQLISIEEKPKKGYFVNTGIYVLEPLALRHLAFNSYCDMPHFLNKLVKHKRINVATFPIQEYWLDVGHQENLTQAVSDYAAVFL